MILGIGIDHIEVERVSAKMTETEGLREQLFTSREIDYCESKRFAAQHYAARFAAKEAFFKAIGTGWRNGMAFDEVEITNDEMGRPDLVVHGRAEKAIEENKISNIQVSLSHTKHLAGAIVTLEKL